ncbi:MAG: tRNA (adenosine(37)-N6)-threonylcarbamoyltransferase complex dimerization subunit type 1 TsaB [Thermodesulfobacteriota bacterium]
MLLLGIDTTTRVGSVGVVRAPIVAPAHEAPSSAIRSDVAGRCEVLADVVRHAGLEHGSALLASIDESLATAGVALEEVAAIAVASGPGSFTGLRVALATAKGLALGSTVALVGVPTLEALACTLLPGWLEPGLAQEIPPGTLVAACLDARKGEVYGAIFAVRAEEHGSSCVLERLTPDRALRKHAFRETLAALLARGEAGARALLIGDGAERHRAQIVDALEGRAVALPFARYHPRGAAVARVGAALLAANGPDDRAELVPHYARASEAEIARARSADEGPSR